MKNFISLLLKISTLFLITLPLFAQSYYVDAVNGDDSNTGITRQNAWQTIDKLSCALDKYNCGIIKPHDRVWLKRGSIFLGQTLELNELDNIRFGAYGMGNKPIIAKNEQAPANIEEVMEQAGFALGISNSQKIRFDNIEFQGGWTSIFLANSSNIKLIGLTIGKNSKNGVIITKESNKHLNHHITINNCRIESHFTFPYSKEDSINERSEDGILVYEMQNSKITNNYLKNWGHASINIDANTKNGDISKNRISDNYLTSPDMAYGGRIVLDDSHHNLIKTNHLVNTSVSSQLGGYNNKYINNLFLNTTVPPSELGSNNTAVLIEAYSNHKISANEYIGNRIINSEGIGLTISDAGGLDIKDNIFRNNTISGCGFGDTANNISIKIEPNSEGASYSNVFKYNKILNLSKDTISYRGSIMDVNEFNKQNSHDDQIKHNIGTQL